MRRTSRVKNDVARSRQSGPAARLEAIAAKLLAVNAEQSRAGLNRLRMSLLDLRAKGITGDAGEVSYGKSPEDVV